MFKTFLFHEKFIDKFFIESHPQKRVVCDKYESVKKLEGDSFFTEKNKTS
jgi:hypothetical protein